MLRSDEPQVVEVLIEARVDDFVASPAAPDGALFVVPLECIHAASMLTGVRLEMRCASHSCHYWAEARWQCAVGLARYIERSCVLAFMTPEHHCRTCCKEACVYDT